MDRLKSFIGRYAKALILLALIALAGAADAAGVDVGLDPEHYVGLLAADFLVWLTPNSDDGDE